DRSQSRRSRRVFAPGPRRRPPPLLLLPIICPRRSRLAAAAAAAEPALPPPQAQPEAEAEEGAGPAAEERIRRSPKRRRAATRVQNRSVSLLRVKLFTGQAGQSSLQNRLLAEWRSPSPVAGVDDLGPAAAAKGMGRAGAGAGAGAVAGAVAGAAAVPGADERLPAPSQVTKAAEKVAAVTVPSLSKADATAAPDWGERVTGPRRNAMRPTGLPADWAEPAYGWCRSRMSDFRVVLDHPKDAVETPTPVEMFPLTARVGLPLPRAPSQFLFARGLTLTLTFHQQGTSLQSAFGQSGGKGCIQLWEMGQAVSDRRSRLEEAAPNSPVLAMCLLHDFGCVWQMRWGPYGAFDRVGEEEVDEESHFPKIGILAASCGDGSIKLIVVPSPDAVRDRTAIARDETLYGKPDAIMLFYFVCSIYLLKAPQLGVSRGEERRELLPDYLPVRRKESGARSISRTGSRTRHVRQTNSALALAVFSGSIVVWDVEMAIQRAAGQRDGPVDDRAGDRAIVHMFLAHDSYIRGIDWNSHAEPTGISSAGMDGRAQAFDVRDPHMPTDFYRDVVASNWHPFVACASSDGRVAIGNVHRTPKRYQKRIQATVFRLHWDKDTRTFSFHNDDPLEASFVSAEPHGRGVAGKSEDAGACRQPENLYTMLFPPEVQIQRAAWSNHPGSLSWVAGGGAAGLVRVDSTWEE
ncbi:MAG: hypothetical protein BJ554DRAFT_831, partial [Olpidium bornovanus]